MLFKKNNQLEKITQDFRNLPYSLEDYEKQNSYKIFKKSVNNSILSTIISTPIVLLIMFFSSSIATLVGLLTLMAFLFFSTFIFSGLYYINFYFQLDDFVYRNRFMDKCKVQTIEEDDTITIQLMKSCVDKFRCNNGIDYCKTDNVLQNYLLESKVIKYGLTAKYDNQILEEKLFDKHQDVEALEYAAGLKIKAEELNQQTVEETKQKLSSAIEQAQIEGLPEVETFSQDIKLLNQSVKELINS